MSIRITQTQKYLIDCMIEKGVKWPYWGKYAFYGSNYGGVVISSDLPEYSSHEECYGVSEYASVMTMFQMKKFRNWHQCVVTREMWIQHGGWIYWNGGDRPVDSEVKVDYTLGSDDFVHTNKSEDLIWECIGNSADITSWRLSDVHDNLEITEDTCGSIGELLSEWKMLQTEADLVWEKIQSESRRFGIRIEK